jgi:hypothetical protein
MTVTVITGTSQFFSNSTPMPVVQAGVTSISRGCLVFVSYYSQSDNAGEIGNVSGVTVGGLAPTLILSVEIPGSGANNRTNVGKAWFIGNPPNGNIVVTGSGTWAGRSWAVSNVFSSNPLGEHTHNEGSGRDVLADTITLESGNLILHMITSQSTTGGTGYSPLVSSNGVTLSHTAVPPGHVDFTVNPLNPEPGNWMVEQQEIIEEDNGVPLATTSQVYVNMLGA